MTLMLASVRTVEEAEIALEGGCDIIDLKEPANGALGALGPETVRQIAAAVAGRRPVSAVTGDLPMEPETLRSAAETIAATGVDYVKVGLFPDERRRECISALAPVAATARLVGVMFADNGADPDLIDHLAGNGFSGVMLDTAVKGQGRLLDHAAAGDLDRFLERAREARLLGGLAGSLEVPDIPRLLALAPDFLGFRGALCHDRDRSATLDPKAVALVRGLIPQRQERRQLRPVDYGALRGGSYPGADPGRFDRIHVRDFQVSAYVGAYAHERERPQRLRFDVVAEVRRAAPANDDMRNVFSYDLIIDAIQRLVSEGHIELLETLAERLADEMLRHAPVMRVSVKVEKLDLGPGAVGVEIERARAAETATVLQLFPTSLERDPKAAS